MLPTAILTCNEFVPFHSETYNMNLNTTSTITNRHDAEALYYLDLHSDFFSISLQAPFNTVKYAIIGHDAAPQYFHINDRTGLVAVKKDLRESTDLFYIVSTWKLICFVVIPCVIWLEERYCW